MCFDPKLHFGSPPNSVTARLHRASLLAHHALLSVKTRGKLAENTHLASHYVFRPQITLWVSTKLRYCASPPRVSTCVSTSVRCQNARETRRKHSPSFSLCVSTPNYTLGLHQTPLLRVSTARLYLRITLC